MEGIAIILLIGSDLKIIKNYAMGMILTIGDEPCA